MNRKFDKHFNLFSLENNFLSWNWFHEQHPFILFSFRSLDRFNCFFRKPFHKMGYNLLYNLSVSMIPLFYFCFITFFCIKNSYFESIFFYKRFITIVKTIYCFFESRISFLIQKTNPFFCFCIIYNLFFPFLCRYSFFEKILFTYNGYLWSNIYFDFMYISIHNNGYNWCLPVLFVVKLFISYLW